MEAPLLPRLLLSLERNPLESLRGLQRLLPQAGEDIVRATHLLGPLVCSPNAEVSGEAEELLRQARHASEAAGAAKAAAPVKVATRKLFQYRSVDVEYWDLPPTDDHLLFGYAVWPLAEQLARLLMGATLGASADSAAREGAVPSVAGKSVLEIGAGVGLTGLACHACSARSVTLSDAEERLLVALREHHAHRAGVNVMFLDWRTDAGEEQHFDIIIGSDILLSVCQGHVYVPRVVGRRLSRSPGARALLAATMRKAETFEVAITELEKQGLDVELFLVSGHEALLPIDRARLQALAVTAVVLLAARWPLAVPQAEHEVDSGIAEIDGDMAELLQLSGT